MESTLELPVWPTWMLIGVGLLVLVQIAIEIYALVQLLKTPDERLMFGKKWPWVLIILFVNLVGAVVFLAAGRLPTPAIDPLATGGVGASGSPSAVRDRTGAAERAAKVLYGGGEGE